MADLRTTFAGIRSPNPFWLASAPPTDKAYNIVRAFKAGWGGVVWKTLGEDPPIVNVSGPRYGAIHGADRRVIGFNNIELITDRPLEVNLREIKQVKRDWPDRALVVSLMVPCEEQNWAAIIKRVEETDADGIELNFGCPHGMSERGMGSAVGQVPEYIEMVTRWCKTHSRMPVIVKLTPNVASILPPAEAAHRGGADAVSLINTVNALMGVDIDLMAPWPHVDGLGHPWRHVRTGGQADRAQHGRLDRQEPGDFGLPVSGIGGIENWRDAAEFMALGAGNVQVCTATMLYGFKIVEEMIDDLSAWMDEKGYARVDNFIGKATPRMTEWQHLNLDYVVKAHIDQDLCIKCGRCHIGCEDTSHQAITSMKDGKRHFEVIEEECVGCNLCAVVCPVENCITMVPLAEGEIDRRTGTEGRRPPHLARAPQQPLGEGTPACEIRGRIAGAAARSARLRPQHRVKDGLPRGGEKTWVAKRALGDSLDLCGEVGVMLCRRPDHEDEVMRVAARQSALRHPAPQQRHLAVDQHLELPAQDVLQHRGAAHHFDRKQPRRLGIVPRVFELLGYVIGQRRARVAVGLDAGERHQPGVQRPPQRGEIEFLLGAEIIQAGSASTGPPWRRSRRCAHRQILRSRTPKAQHRGCAARWPLRHASWPTPAAAPFAAFRQPLPPFRPARALCRHVVFRFQLDSTARCSGSD